jgi:hypothetical protein
MTHFWLGVFGIAVAVIGVALVIFNRQFVNAMPAPKGPAARLKMFKPGPSGRVPILTVIACGWIVVGLVFVLVAVARQPL